MNQKMIDYLNKRKLSPNFYEIKTWPESQVYIAHPEAQLIIDKEGETLFGGSAYIVPKNIEENELNWYNDFDFDPSTEMIVTWPDSQDYMDNEEAQLINDELGLDLFGSSAYRLPLD